jgi:enediyne biosynthesis thioesterase
MPVPKTYDCRHLVTLEETNLVGNVYFTNYLRWQGSCREQFLAEHAPSVLRALREDFVLATVSCHCDFFAELYATDTVEVRMTLGAVDGHRVTMAFDYYRLDGATPQLVARGGQTIACLRRTSAGTIPVPVPDELREALLPYHSVLLQPVRSGRTDERSGGADAVT